VSVDHGGDDIGMSQQFLHCADVITRLKKMRGKELVLSLSKEVAQGMATDRLRYCLLSRMFSSRRHCGVSLNILSGPVFQRFFGQKIGKVFRPVHLKWRTIRPYPVFLRAPPVSFPKTIALFGIADIHDFHHNTLFILTG